MPYYGLYIPAKGSSGAAVSTSSGNHSIKDHQSDSPFVFHKKGEALDVLKKHRDARLKEFLNEDEAIRYAQTGFEIVQNKYNDSSRGSSITSSSSSSTSTSTSTGEKAAFRAPSKHELIEFRKIIEAGDLERVKSMIWENPLYLVSPGDTPTTLKEGYRYNAMHVCAITKRPLVAKLILETVSDPKFTDLLTGHKGDRQICEELCANLLDYYLNIPEKGRSETPLHLAAKNGCLEMIEVLTSYPQCKMIKNHENLLPKDIICDRVCKPNPDLIKKIDLMLNERFFVPVLRSTDGSMPPQIGKPFPANEPPKFNSDPMSPEVEIKALAGPMNKEQAKQFFHRWKTPPRTGGISRLVSTPIANKTNSFISPCKSQQRSMSFSGVNFKRSLFCNSTGMMEDKDEDKEQRSYSFNCPQPSASQNGYMGTPTITMKQSHQQKISEELTTTTTTTTTTMMMMVDGTANLCPSTPLLRLKKDAFFTYRRDSKLNSPMLSPIIDIMKRGSQTTTTTTTTSQQLFPQFNTVENMNDTPPGFKERHIKNSDSEKGLECIGRELAKERNIEWREYWDFLNEFIDITSTNGLQKLENYLANLQKIIQTNESDRTTTTTDKVNAILDNVCSVLDKLSISTNNSNVDLVGKSSSDAFKGGSSLRLQRNGIINNDKKKMMVNNDNNEEDTNNLWSSVSMNSALSKNEKYFNDLREQTAGSSALSTTTAAATTTITSTTTTTSSSSSSSATPYTYVEKSLQVHAKRITKTIVHNIESLESIHDTLLHELRRIKSLICSFKQDSTFSKVKFSKVHSRIGSLVSIFLINSQEITTNMTTNIIDILSSLLSDSRERREHFECVCKRIKTLLECPVEQILPENLKTEEMCRRIWSVEHDCDCQWENSLSRKTSRRNRIEAILKNHQRFHPDENEEEEKEKESNIRSNISTQQMLIGNVNTRHDDHSDNEEEEEDDEEVFWSDIGSEMENSSDEEGKEIWLTPPESQSRLSPVDLSAYHDNDQQQQSTSSIFIFGDEPTKRDLDVLNAIFHVEIDATTYPCITNWKRTLLRFTNDEMDYFPSPRIPRKANNSQQSRLRPDRVLKTPRLLRSQSYTILNNHQHHHHNNNNNYHHYEQQQKQKQKNQLEQSQGFISPAPPVSSSVTLSQRNLGFLWRGLSEDEEQRKEIMPEGGNLIRNQLSSVKRLFMSPKAAANKPKGEEQQRLSGSSMYEMRRPLTPMNKLRDLFSAYREAATEDVNNKSFNNSMEDLGRDGLITENSNSNNNNSSSEGGIANKSSVRSLSLLNVSTFK